MWKLTALLPVGLSLSASPLYLLLPFKVSLFLFDSDLSISHQIGTKRESGIKVQFEHFRHDGKCKQHSEAHFFGQKTLYLDQKWEEKSFFYLLKKEKNLSFWNLYKLVLK